MKTTDKIILYLDNQLKDDERIKFEKELEASGLLRKQLDEYRELLKKSGELKNIETDPGYFINMIPNFRQRLESKKKSKILPRLALGLSTLTAVVLILVFTLNNKTTDINKIVNDVSGSSTQDYVLNYSPLSDQVDLNNLPASDDANIDSVISSLLTNELNISSQSYSEIMANNNSTDLQTMLQGINSNEADMIYNELLHKRIY